MRDSTETQTTKELKRAKCFAAVIMSVILLSCVVLSLLYEGSPIAISSRYSSSGTKVASQGGSNTAAIDTKGPAVSVLPDELFELGIYNESDFVNEIGKSPPYWKPDPTDDTGLTWGPCFPEYRSVDWFDERDVNDSPAARAEPEEYMYRRDPKDLRMKTQGPPTSDGGCRPGFLIIGAGKCGTSSLYHYLIGHPRVAPAFSKQIHYFVYHLEKPMAWYYSWFPTAPSYLRHGTLVTGEASPGYLPYPKVVKAVNRLLPGNPKIISVGRNPLERMYSSYKYNYRIPTLEIYKKGRKAGIASHQDDEHYEPYFFSFEDLIKAELTQLRSCFESFGPKETRDRWYNEKWARVEFDRREAQGLDPLIDLDLVCYGTSINQTVLRPQWAELQMAHPERYIPSKSAFLIQSLIGRSLYVFPLEWWYILFDPQDIEFYCTEDLKDPSKLNDLAMNMGLPSYNFTDVVAQGAFNVGEHRGYDKATSWEEVQNEQQQQQHEENTTITSRLEDGIPLSTEARQEVLDFIRPFNERLFQLVGKRCDW